ncbi:MAG: hypothetical protein LBP73_10185 [Clostridiales Family XIII bacterium]|jgi:hypothetical protein|nr:hypothetical protein [Clostridiales Family XIII bacterium]
MLFLLICLYCAAIFGGIALWAYKRRDPAHFWAGSTIKPEEIADIPAYNRAIGRMWATFAGGMALSGVIGAADALIGGIVLGFVCAAGIPIMILVYGRIYRKYSA